MPEPKEPPPVPVARNERLDPAIQAAARKELDTALESPDPFIRAHGVEAAQNTLGPAGKSIYLAALKDRGSAVRFAGAMAIGQLQIAEARNQLLQMINDPSQHVGIGVRFALHRLGDKTYSKDFETLARDPQPQIRATTAMALGMLGEPTAVRVLRPMQRDAEALVRLQVAEALWRLGNEDGLKTLVAQSASGRPPRPTRCTASRTNSSLVGLRSEL